ncbi:MAG TPA: hypothetical protein VFV01_03200 [Spirillospora sp.]|nr:hypothetical protein [Spirillospora sp.]
MTVTKPTTGLTSAPLKAALDPDELITDGAHFLGMAKKELVGEAVRAYLVSRREEMHQAMLVKLRKLDGSTTSRVSLKRPGFDGGSRLWL